MKVKAATLKALAGAVGLAAALSAGSVLAQAKEQFFPVLSYRTGAYAPNGTPWANGYVDYLKLVNAKGGINGVTITFEECETGYATSQPKHWWSAARKTPSGRRKCLRRRRSGCRTES